ncbi:MAG: low molecular weight phosphotyrosine protein phosphatase [Bacteroidetes bacterium]|nr:MAG: low molecular weight phosphotyrosine protein phosphatase [Bacteroidota bacterium]MBL1144291.1 low molecular weight phosphotyrosine protein phosphatase [Bacteroidota bacterium]MCB0802683.1 low molecular weight phosphotyrosine protein phosphatase [Flavobacteriales bacterium]NOG57088.1 low molecular weight phosphotyrosine protein phosphatase [Bacteroidota bacterium]
MVCLGNICRSPMAEGILKQKAEKHKLAIEIDSAGTSDYHIGDKPDKRASSTCFAKGIDISNLRGRQLCKADFDEFDRIFVMDFSNYENSIALVNEPEKQAKVEMILNLSYPGENRSVPDPYFGGDEGFEQVYHLLDNACDVLIEQIKNEES